jgi:hypothetical protein
VWWSARYNFQAIIDEVVGVIHMMRMFSDTKSITVVCPENGGAFVVDVPVALYSGQSLVSLK